MVAEIFRHFKVETEIGLCLLELGPTRSLREQNIRELVQKNTTTPEDIVRVIGEEAN